MGTLNKVHNLKCKVSEEDGFINVVSESLGLLVKVKMFPNFKYRYAINYFFDPVFSIFYDLDDKKSCLFEVYDRFTENLFSIPIREGLYISSKLPIKREGVWRTTR